jgi:regulator of sigma E protease
LIQTPGLLLTILAFVLVVGPLVFLHELGHYLAGRLFGVKADIFSIGFGNEIAGFTDRLGTRWKLSWLPIGGYVKFAGDMSAAGLTDPAWLMLPPEQRARTFQAKPVWQRAIIVAAGPLTNFLVAIVILAGFAMAYGVSRTPTIAGKIIPGSAAAKAGIQTGDRIVALGGRPMQTFDDLVFYVTVRAGEPVIVTLDRGGRTLTRQATIGSDVAQDRFGNKMTRGLLGIAPTAPVLAPVSLWEAPGVAIKRTGMIIRMTVETLAQVIRGERSVKQLQGPIGMAKASGEQLSLGLDAFVGLIALVSINLGFINLLPVPMLDGGHLFFYMIEAVRRRPVTPEIQEWAFRGGLAALLALMMLVTFNDIGALGVWDKLAGLIG